MGVLSSVFPGGLLGFCEVVAPKVIVLPVDPVLHGLG